MIVKDGNEYIVTNKTGTKILGRHKTKAEALAQLRAIEISKYYQKK